MSICIISLYYLSKNTVGGHTVQKSSFKEFTFYKSSISNIDKKNINNLPPQPEERWHYIQEFKKKDNDLENLYHLVKSNINSTNKNILSNENQLVQKIDNKKFNSPIHNSQTNNKKKILQN
ncbi:MAG: hypothetical protein RA159_03265 [Arsenophonus sp.]|nr:MAG: hypothetical protein RA159_03265 [Arsenophonus sp.]